MVQYGTVEQIVASLRESHGTGKTCTLLLGAGCSQSAGIPVAAGLVDLIREKFPAAYAAAETKSYAHCMAALEEEERRALMSGLMDRARINVAHLVVARLFASGYVDSILTTNFDPLLVRALALEGEHPPVYDMALSPRFRFRASGMKAVFYLNGQQQNPLLLTGSAEYEWHATQLAPLFEDAGRDRMWLVVGSSGDNNPALDLLGKIYAFDRTLFWCGEGITVPDSLRNALFIPRKSVSYVPECDADRLFAQILRQLGGPAPAVLARPLARVGETVSALAPFIHAKGVGPLDLGASFRHAINEAAAQYEIALAPEVQFLLGDYADVIGQRKDILVDNIPAAVDALVWSYLLRGQELAEKGRLDSDGLGRKDFVAAYDSFAAALKLRPSLHQALTGWGAALLDQAEVTPGMAGEVMYADAYRKFSEALAIDPTLAETYYKWGNGLISQAETRGAAADPLYEEAYSKYAKAVDLCPSLYVAFNNWGIALSDQAKLAFGAKAKALFTAAYEKFERAVAVKPDLHETLYNWGIALFDHACIVDNGAESDQLYAAAYAKYAEAARIRPLSAETYFNWGWALSMQTRVKIGPEADRLFAEAHAKYAEALRLKPDMSEAHHNWAWSLTAQARSCAGEEAEKLYTEASARYAEAVARSPRDFNVINNWGNMLCDQALSKEGAEADRLFALAYEKFALAVRYKPDMEGAFTNWGGALSAQAQSKTGAERDRLLAGAEEKCRRVEELRPGRGAYNLACLAAMRQREEDCRNWLEVSLNAGFLPDRHHLATDSDLAFVHDRPWFQGLLASVSV